MGLSNSTQKNEAQRTKQIFILSGQSNMSGRGGVFNHHWDSVVPLECSPDASKIFRLNAHLGWEVAHEPLHRDIDNKKTCGVGPGMSFANAVKERVGVVGLVPCAVGGTRIKQWARGSHLYENMIRRARAAAAQGTEIKALLWYQGESDTTTRDNAESYKENMEKFIHNVRADLHLPSLPIIQVAIASGEGKFIEKIRQVQKGIDVPNVVCVDAKGLELKEDNLHLTTRAQVELGHMLAEAYLTHFVSPSDSVI
ncbi:probable carbohydrate esterase At4g34215 [Olea europaea var. sylvestris]|uniref:probable carbohydrate esterase At4g34215 n=1 Tax=Olea europaea var. sylvestris TaxID=158386 RepID=UPI000C1CF13E|nr:probable carbohydrate esterase At4g34215 [Olea europaea var. sylvestris]